MVVAKGKAGFVCCYLPNNSSSSTTTTSILSCASRLLRTAFPQDAVVSPSLAKSRFVGLIFAVLPVSPISTITGSALDVRRRARGFRWVMIHVEEYPVRSWPLSAEVRTEGDRQFHVPCDDVGQSSQS